MAQTVHIQSPFVLKDDVRANLVGEVFGQTRGSKKRKRAELTVATHGDAIHLHDASAQSITSYLVSPLAVFTCPPCSLRWRCPDSKTTTRYTYAATTDKTKQEVKLFKDTLLGSGNTESHSLSHTLLHAHPIVHLALAARQPSPPAPLILQNGHELLLDVVCLASDGEVVCLDGETLALKWRTAPSALLQDLRQSEVNFVQTAPASDVVQGVFSENHDLFGVFGQKVDLKGFNPDIFLAITTGQSSGGSRHRHLHLFSVTADKTPGLIPIYVAPIPQPGPSLPGASKYQLDVRSGTLQELLGDSLYTYSLDGGIARLTSTLHVPGATSFLRLSKSSVLVAKPTELLIYNPLYCSLLAKRPFCLQHGTHQADHSSSDPLELVTYFASRNMAVGVQGSSLVAVQVETPRERSSKRRAEGLLVDSLRRGVAQESYLRKRSKHAGALPSSAVSSGPLPASATEEPPEQWQSQAAGADALLDVGDARAFEEFMAGKFSIKLKEEDGSSSTATDLREWVVPRKRSQYRKPDRRWVFYAISRVFAWDASGEGSRLSCQHPESSVLSYLVDAGHLSLSNLRSSFKEEFGDMDMRDVSNTVGEELPVLLAEIDPAMELLVAYLAGTQLGPAELITAIRLIMRSLGFVEDASKLSNLLTGEGDGGDNESFHMELDQAEAELQLIEQHLVNGDEGGFSGSTRARGLSVAFSKLVMCPAMESVQALRRLLSPEEILCMINVLRMQLIKDGWTTRYLDMSPSHAGGMEGALGEAGAEDRAPPDNSIRIMADLLCRCVDAIGVGGWLALDTRLATSASRGPGVDSGTSAATPTGDDQNQPDYDSLDFFGQFQAEISVALEGIEEVINLQGFVDETVRFLSKARSQQAVITETKKGKMRQRENKAIAHVKHLPHHAGLPTGAALPLGLKPTNATLAAPAITREKVTAGGEVVPRSAREIGLLMGKHAGKYSVQRISEAMLMEGTK